MAYGSSLWPLLLDLARLAVLVLLASKGGRYERTLAWMFVPLWLAEQIVRKLPDAMVFGGAGAVELAFLAGHVWLLWRHRPAWLVAATLAQAGKTGLVLAFGPIADAPDGLAEASTTALAYAHLACLTLAVARRRLGPPAAVPASAD